MSLTENKMFVVSNSDEFDDAIFMTAPPPPLFFLDFQSKTSYFINSKNLDILLYW